MTTRIENFRLSHALAYAKRGWKVFPLHHPLINSSKPPRCACGNPTCGSIGKHPLSGHGFYDATCDPLELTEWWDEHPAANVGLATGKVSGFVVLDVDFDKNGHESLEKIIRQYSELPQTVESETGNGRHLLFQCPDIDLRNSSGQVGPGLDIRANGGYIVAPPSLHRSGKRYQWTIPPNQPMASMPDWLLKLAMDRPKPTNVDRPATDLGRVWLGKALAKVTLGNRNDTGMWLACQLRDAGVSNFDGESLMREFASRCPQGDEPYRDREALATWKSALSKPQRDPAVSANATIAKAHFVPVPTNGAASELRDFIHGVIDGKIYNVPWPWPQLTTLTQALISGSVTLVCGEPGVGKTFLILDCLRHWYGNGFNPAVFFCEKDRKFYAQRLLSQLEGKGCYSDFKWVGEHPQEARDAMSRHSAMIDEIGKCIYDLPTGTLSFDLLIGWMKDRCRDGCRVLVIDPITAADAGKERWTADQNFVNAAQQLMTKHGASLVLVTHPKKGTRYGQATGHDIAGGAAFFRFADTEIWVHKSKHRKKIRVQTPCGPCGAETDVFFQLHKTRSGKGHGMQIAYEFGDGLHFSELGVVVKDEDGDA